MLCTLQNAESDIKLFSCVHHLAMTSYERGLFEEDEDGVCSLEKGHKGQKSRSGGSVKPGFEGGQMPIQRRLPKFGFTSRKAMVTAEVNLAEIAKVDGDTVELATLKAAGLVRKNVLHAKVIKSGELSRAVTVKGLKVTKGAREAIEAAGGKIEG